jgi:uncharacterized protein (DUF1778 family)
MKRNCSIKIKADADQRAVIEHAARLVGISGPEFVLEAAFRAAYDMLCDQDLFHLELTDFEHFQSMMNDPPEPTENLRCLLLTQLSWE